MSPELKHLRIDRSPELAPKARLWGSKRSLVIGSGALISAAAAFAFIATRAPLMRVDVMTVHAEHTSSGSGGILLNATGYIVAAHKIDVATKVDGRVAWIGVEKGDPAKAGQALVRLEADEYQAKVQEAAGEVNYLKAKLIELKDGSRPQEIARAEADRAQAQSEMENARITLQRTRQLADEHVLSRQALDDATAKVEQEQAKLNSLAHTYDLARLGPRFEEIDAARGQLQQAEGTLAYARTQLQNTVIRAPIAGTVLERNVEPGEFVTTGFASDNGARGYVVSLADLHQLQVELDISQDDFSRLLPDQAAIVTTDAYPDRKYAGVIDEISPVANRQKATVEVRVKIANPDHFLRPDMNASVAFLATAEQQSSGRAPQPLSLPRAAIRNQGVFVIVDGKATYRKVRISGTSAEESRIAEGLKEDDQVIVNPPAGLKDGQAVTPMQRTNP